MRIRFSWVTTQPVVEYSIHNRERQTLSRYPDGTLGHWFYRRRTHTNLYLNHGSHHHPSNIQGLLSTYVHRAKVSLRKGEPPWCVGLLQEHFQIKKVIVSCRKDGHQHGGQNLQADREVHLSRSSICPDDIRQAEQIAGQTQRVALPPRKTSSLLCPVKNDMRLTALRVLSGIHRTDWSLYRTRLTEHHRHTGLGHADKSTVVEHKFYHNFVVKFQDLLGRRWSWSSTLTIWTWRTAWLSGSWKPLNSPSTL